MPPKASIRGEYIETETGNKISRRASILGPKHIILAGKCVIQHDAVLHGDLVRPSTSKPSSTTDSTAKTDAPAHATSIHLGRYVFISPSAVLHPPSRLTTISPSSSSGTNADGSNSTPAHPQQTAIYYPLRILDSVYIGPFSVIRAAEIRSNVHIGSHCVIGNFVIIKENVRILDGTVLPANSVWSSGVVVGGRPGRVVGEVGEGWGVGDAAGGKGEDVGGGGFGMGVGVRARERWASVGNKK